MATSPSVVPNVGRDEMATVRVLPSDLVERREALESAGKEQNRQCIVFFGRFGHRGGGPGLSQGAGMSARFVLPVR